MLKGRIVRVRWSKNYASARNHVAIGLAEEVAGEYLLLKCRLFHFGRLVNGRCKFSEEPVALRAVPWTRVEVINVLAEETDWMAEVTRDESGNLVLAGEERTIIARVSNNRTLTGRNGERKLC